MLAVSFVPVFFLLRWLGRVSVWARFALESFWCFQLLAAKSLKKESMKVYDALFRIIPEGFRVVDHYSEDEIIALTCTDELMQEKWIDKSREIIAKMRSD